MVSKLIEVTDLVEIENRIKEAAASLRQGEISSAHDILLEHEKLELPPNTQIKNLIQLSIAEWHLGNTQSAINYILKGKSLVTQDTDNYEMGQLHGTHALILRRLAEQTESVELYDQAILEWTASSFYFEQAGVINYQARVENNLAFIQLQLERFDDALSHAEKARSLTESIGDASLLACIYDTIAQIYLAMNQLDSAYNAIRMALKQMPENRETIVWIDTSLTLSKILFKFGNHKDAKRIIEDAITVALKLDRLTMLGELYMTLLEEGESVLLPLEIVTLYQKTFPLLISDKNKARLARVGLKLFELLSPESEKAHIDKLNMRLEKESLKRALANSNGGITRAAASMDYSYQRVDYLLEHIYLDLQSERTPRIKRKKSIVKKFAQK